MTSYLVTFDDGRIGRHHDVQPLTVQVRDDLSAKGGHLDAIAEQVYDYARPKLSSRDVEVVVDDDRGSILCGFNNGGTFTVHTTPAEGGAR